MYHENMINWNPCPGEILSQEGNIKVAGGSAEFCKYCSYSYRISDYLDNKIWA